MSSSDQTGERDYPFYGNVRPLLGEVLHAVDRLLDTGEPTSIDLAGLPFGPGELEHLEALRGGEVQHLLQRQVAEAVGDHPELHASLPQQRPARRARPERFRRPIVA